MITKKIFFIIDTMGVGGAETQLLRIMPHLKKLDWDIKLVTLKGKSEFRAELESMNVTYRSFGFSGNILTSLNRIRRLASEINRHARENRLVIHSHIVSSNLFSRFFNAFPEQEYCPGKHHPQYQRRCGLALQDVQGDPEPGPLCVRHEPCGPGRA